MPNLRPILCLINNAIQKGAFPDMPFSSGKYNTLAYPILTYESGVLVKEQPGIVSENDDIKPVAIDDTYPLQIYYKLDGLTQDTPKSFDFGPSGTFQQETASLRLIFCGDRSKLKKEQEDIEAMLEYYFPKQFNAATLKPLGLTTVEVYTDGCNLDKLSVFNQEYKGVEYKLKPNNILLSISFKIETIFNGACFSLCNTAQTINN